ncbi:MAG: hypothetical protein IRZ09_09005 [Variibacter sp.]|nr:hypothetical protein [Variibacter sp.]
MRDDRPSTRQLGLILAAILLAALMIFLSSGGDLGGTKKVESDADLPQVASPPPPAPQNTGAR